MRGGWLALGMLTGLGTSATALAAPERAPPAQTRWAPEAFRSGMSGRVSLASGVAPGFREVLPFAMAQVEGRYRYLHVDAGVSLGLRQDWIFGAKVTPLLLERVGMYLALRWSEPIVEPKHEITDASVAMLSMGIEVPFGADRLFSMELGYWQIRKPLGADGLVALQLGVGGWLF